MRNFRAQYQIDEETDGVVWLTHPHPALADSLQTIDDNQRTVKGTIDVSLRPFGKVCFVLFLNRIIPETELVVYFCRNCLCMLVFL